MLLRAGLIYVLTVLTMLLGGLAAWQRLDISLRDESVAVLSKRINTLQNDLSALSRREEAAIRRARVAEDSLTRNETYRSSDVVRPNITLEQLAAAQLEKAAMEDARLRLEADLAQATKDRDQVRIERDELQRETDQARLAAEKALQAADAARQELSDLKKAAPVVTNAAPPPVPEAPVSEVKVVPDELVRPAAEISTANSSEANSSEVNSGEVNSSDVKAALVPSAVTIEPVPKSEKRATPKGVTVKSEPRRAASKPSTGSNSAVKKAPKQAKKDEPFFPF